MNISRSLAMGASAALVALALTASAVQAKQICKPMVWGYGKTVNKSISKHKAMVAWKVNTKNQHGSAYAKYVKAKAKSGKCRKEGNKWHCVRKGKPCKSGAIGPVNEISG